MSNNLLVLRSPPTFTGVKHQNLSVMLSIGELLQPTQTRLPLSSRPAESVYVHLADPIRRALLRAIGFDAVHENYLKAAYGTSWGSVQPALRALVQGGFIEICGIGAQTTYQLDLSQFPRALTAGLFGAMELRAVA